jgi:uncharacterized protein YceK
MKSGKVIGVKMLLLLGGIAAIVVTTFAAPGCGTLANQQKPHPRPYGGVVAEFKDNHELYGPAVFPCMLIGFPLTIVGDTLMFPFDVYSTVTSTNR